MKWKKCTCLFFGAMTALLVSCASPYPISSSAGRSNAETLEQLQDGDSGKRASVDTSKKGVEVIPPGKEFCKWVGLSGQLFANCATLDFWSLSLEDYVTSETLAAREQLLQRADKGDAQAQFHLGLVYETGSEKDYQSAADWYRKSANQGNLCAQHNLAMLYLQGQGVKQSGADAVKMLRISAAQGFARSQRVLWKILFFGHGGVHQEYLNAMKWLRTAAVQGEPLARDLYFELFRNRGYGALFWKHQLIDAYSSDAKKGDPIAQYLMGFAAGYNGNREEMITWMRKAAEQRLVEAQQEMTLLLSRPYTSAETSRWIRKALEQGLVESRWETAMLSGGLSESEAAEHAKWMLELEKREDVNWWRYPTGYQESCANDKSNEDSARIIDEFVKNRDLERVKAFLVQGAVGDPAGFVKLLLEYGADGQSLLDWTIYWRRADLVEALLKNGTDPRFVGSRGNSALQNAVYGGQLRIAGHLLKYGADVNEGVPGGGTLLHWSVKMDKRETVSYLIEKGAHVDAKQKDGNTPLHLATAQSAKNYVDLLVENGANVNVANSVGNTALHVAASEGNRSIVSTLLVRGANVRATNDQGSTPLHLAVNRDVPELVKALLAGGADANGPVNKYGQTPLMSVVLARKCADCVALLLAHGAGVTKRDNRGRTPLHVAAEVPHWADIFAGATSLSVVKLLVVNGAEINATDFNGDTPLLLAVRSRNIEIVSFLIDGGGDIQVRNKNGQNVIDIARSGGSADLLEILLSAQRKLSPTQ